MTAKIISLDEARARRRAELSPRAPVSYDNAMEVAWAMLDEGEVGAHEFLELCREAMAEG